MYKLSHLNVNVRWILYRVAAILALGSTVPPDKYEDTTNQSRHFKMSQGDRSQ